jgi:hypothetical protein
VPVQPTPIHGDMGRLDDVAVSEDINREVVHGW